MNNKIAIIGAGLTGLTCAKLLEKLSFDISIFESSNKVGGRIHTEEINGFKIDCGFQVLLDSYQAVKRNLDLNKLELSAFDSGALIGNVSNCVAHPLRHPQFLLSTLFCDSFTTIDKAIILRLISQAFFNYNVGNQNDLKNDQSTLEYLVEQGLSDKCISEFFKPFFGGVFLDKTLQTSSRMFEFTFGHFARGRATIPANGMKQIPLQISEQISSNKFFLNTPITNISKNGALFELTDNNGHKINAKKVIIASESFNASSLLRNLTLPDSLDSLLQSSRPYQHTFCLHFSAPKPPYKQKMIFLSPNKDSAILHLCPISNVNSRYSFNSSSLISVTSLLPSSTSLDEVKQQVVKELFALFGEQVSSWDCIDNRLIQYALPKTTKGSLTPWHRTSMIDNGIYIGGDYTETPSINGAIEAAENIVGSILNSNNEI